MIDGQRNRAAANSLSFNPFTRRDGQFTVSCPKCGATFVSDQVKFLGVVNRRNFFSSFFGVLVLLGLVFLFGPRLLAKFLGIF
jgi:hypothetical protein